MAKRLNYFFRQKVTESELDDGFALLEASDRALMLDLFQTGVLSGLAVTERGAGPNLSVDVAAGVAYDKLGQRIQFSATQNVDVSIDENAVTTAVSTGGNSKIISVFAKFKRVLTDPRTDGNSVTVYFQEAESFEFIVRQGSEAGSPVPVSADTTYILLADITRVFGDTSVTNAMIDVSATNRREDAFKVAGTPNRLQRGSIKNAVSDIVGWINTEIAARIAADTADAAAWAAAVAGEAATRASAVATEAGTRATDDAIIAAALTAHISASGAHAASAISYAGSAAWADATSVTSADVESAIDEIVSDLTAGGGGGKIGAVAVGGSYTFGVTATTIQTQIDAIVGYLDLGARGRLVTTITANTTLTNQRQIKAPTNAGAFTLTLPAPALGLEFYVKDTNAAGSWGTNNLTLAPNGGEKIEGVAGPRVFAADFGSFRVWSDGTDWFLG